MAALVLLTARLVQRGSGESKSPDEPNEADETPTPDRAAPDAPGIVKRGGVALRLYEHSLSIALLAVFLFSFILHAWPGARSYSDDRVAHGQPAVSAVAYLGHSRFWFESLQNWQSEFLSVLAMVVLSIFLREKGSAESKPLAAPHRKTGR